MSSFCIALSIICVQVFLSGEIIGLDIGDFENFGKEYKHIPAEERVKRSSKLLAALLRRATPAYEDGNYKRFYLYGGYSQAMKDFKGLQPTHVEDLETLIRGRVGEAVVIVNKKGPTVLTILREQPQALLQSDRYTSVELDAVKYLDD